LTLQLGLRTASESCDIYVNENANPTQTLYTYHEATTSQGARVVIDSPGDTIHHIGIFGSHACHYTIRARLVGRDDGMDLFPSFFSSSSSFFFQFYPIMFFFPLSVFV
jgi:hypothetical protein